MSLIFNAIFASVSLSHLVVDILNGTRAVLLAYLSVPLALSNAELGLVSTIYVISAALIGPIFGYLTDRVGPRLVVAGGVLWMGAFYALALIVPGPQALLFLIFASLGSGAFHPAGGMQATLTGQTLYAGRETTAASFFFLFGQLGHFAGPVMAGPLLDMFGPAGLLVLAAPTAPMGFFALRQLAALPAVVPKPETNNGKKNKPRLAINGGVAAAGVFGLMTLCQSWAQGNMTTFIPKYLSDLGHSPSIYGTVAALFMGGSALGNVLGGMLADRFGRRKVAAAALLLAVAPLLLVPEVGMTWIYLVVPLAGFFTGSVQSIIVVHGQHLIPGGMALATGLILGFTFSSGAIGTYLSGIIADSAGFTPVFRLSAALAGLGAVAAFYLFRPRGVLAAQQQPGD